MIQKYSDFLQKFPKAETDKPLAPFDSMGIGGPADLFYKLTDTAEIESLIKTAQELKIPYVILGGGSNTIFADRGFRGLVIKIDAKKIALENAGTKDSTNTATISAEAGALLSQVIQFALKNTLTGMEKMMGLPGTIGGAVRGNAGAFGAELKDNFAKALIYNPEKGLFEAGHDYLNFSYRTSSVKTSKDIVLKVFLKLKKDAELSKAAQLEATDIVKNRISKQPKGKCSGSFFKNPGGSSDPTQGMKSGYLLEQSGCKGMQVGGAQVSPQHANWIMNTGTATQKDVLALCKQMQDKVQEKFNIHLEPEVQFIGETGFLSTKAGS